MPAALNVPPARALVHKLWHEPVTHLQDPWIAILIRDIVGRQALRPQRLRYRERFIHTPQVNLRWRPVDQPAPGRSKISRPDSTSESEGPITDDCHPSVVLVIGEE